MIRFYLVIALYIVLQIGCVPGNLESLQQTSADQLFSESDNVSTIQITTTAPALKPIAPKLPLKEIVTPNPSGQILDDTNWVLEHAIIEGEFTELKDFETLWIYFRPDQVGIFDGCNHGAYISRDGQSSYVATENGEFVLPWVEHEEDVTYVSEMLACPEMGLPKFLPPFEDIIAYELKTDQLHLFYPEDGRNALVFRQLIFQPEPTDMPTKKPKPTMTADATATIILASSPKPILQLTPYPGLTPIPTAAYP